MDFYASSVHCHASFRDFKHWFPPTPRKSILEGLGIGRQTLVCMVPYNSMRCVEARQSLEEFQIQC